MRHLVFALLFVFFTLISGAEARADNTRGNTIDVFVYRASVYLNFDTPQSLYFSTIRSFLLSKIHRFLPGSWGNAHESMLGHVALRYQCSDGQTRWTGQTGQKHNQGLHITLQGGGLLPMLSVFTDGYLERNAESEEMLKAYQPFSEKVRIMRVHTTLQKCQNLAHFIHDYEKAGASQNYSLVYQPREYYYGKSKVEASGGGCASFAAGGLLRAGIIDEALFETLTFERKIDLSLVSYLSPEKVPFYRMEQQVAGRVQNNPKLSLWEMAFGERFKKWSTPESKDVYDLKIIDPEWFFTWVDAKAKEPGVKWLKGSESPYPGFSTLEL